MSASGTLLPLAALVLAAGCAATPTPGPSDQRRGFLALRARVAPGPGPDRETATTVYFVRLGQGQSADRGSPVIESNFQRGRMVYLLDVEPGRYAAVACGRTTEGKREVTFFPSELIARLVVDVPARGAIFLGDLELTLSYVTASMDDAQRFYWSKIHPASYQGSELERAVARTRATRPTLWRLELGPETLREMYGDARRQLGGSEWAARVPEEP